MCVPLDVLGAFAVAALMLVGAFLVQIERQRRTIAGLKQLGRPLEPVVVRAAGAPDPGPHQHRWAKHYTSRGEWRMHFCQVPGCTEHYDVTGGAMPPGLG